MNKTKFLGCNKLTIKFASTATPKVTIQGPNSDGSFVLFAVAGITKTSMHFKPDKEFDETSMMREKCKSIITFDKNTMVHVQKGSYCLLFILND